MPYRVAIVTDTTACIPQNLIDEYSIELVPVILNFGDNSYRDRLDMSTDKFYALLRKSEELPTTSVSPPGFFLEAYRSAGQKADSILCITVPAKLSGMFNSATLAAEESKGTLPRITVKVIDCGTVAAAQGLIVLAAARAAAIGKSLNEVTRVTENIMQRVHLLGCLDTLHYLVKGGRVPRAAALASSLLQIKPIFTVKEGEAYSVASPRTTEGAIKKLLKIMEQKLNAEKPVHAAVMHADDMDKALLLKDQIAKRFNCVELFITEFTPVMGVHTGPGVVGTAFYNED